MGQKDKKTTLQTLIMLPILLPEVITGLSLLLFFLLIRFPMGFFSIVIAHASFSASFVYLILVEQFRKLDPRLEEAALDLGAKPNQVFWTVTLPNIMPGVYSGWLLAFTLSFDDFLISYFTGGSGVTTLPLKIYSLMRMGVDPELPGLSLVMLAISSVLVLTLFAKEKNRKWALKS
jgi:ABC-type spermidine/putrescine transport system permease subunit II